MAKHANKWMIAVVVLIIAVVGGGFAWKYLHQSALPGVAYVQLDSDAQWPESLQPPPDLQ